MWGCPTYVYVTTFGTDLHEIMILCQILICCGPSLSDIHCSPALVCKNETQAGRSIISSGRSGFAQRSNRWIKRWNPSSGVTIQEDLPINGCTHLMASMQHPGRRWQTTKCGIPSVYMNWFLIESIWWHKITFFLNMMWDVIRKLVLYLYFAKSFGHPFKL